MADNNKISINVSINADGQQQISQYSNAFDGLRKSITGLSKPIDTLNKSFCANLIINAVSSYM